MKLNNQSLIIIFVGVALNLSIFLGTDIAIITGLTGVLGGIYVGHKTQPQSDDTSDEGYIPSSMEASP